MIVTHGNATQNLDKVGSIILEDRTITFYEGKVLIDEIRDGLKGREHFYKHVGSVYFKYETEGHAKRAFNQINELLNAIEV